MLTAHRARTELPLSYAGVHSRSRAWSGLRYGTAMGGSFGELSDLCAYVVRQHKSRTLTLTVNIAFRFPRGSFFFHATRSRPSWSCRPNNSWLLVRRINNKREGPRCARIMPVSCIYAHVYATALAASSRTTCFCSDYGSIHGDPPKHRRADILPPIRNVQSPSESSSGFSRTERG